VVRSKSNYTLNPTHALDAEDLFSSEDDEASTDGLKPSIVSNKAARSDDASKKFKFNNFICNVHICN
jgi:hypothetical protein